jgi:hypothetical protein
MLRTIVGAQIPAWRRLDAGREPAILDLVLPGPDLLDFVAEEDDVRVLAGHLRRDDAAGRGRLSGRRDARDARRVVERAQPGLDVEDRAVGGDTVVALGEDDVAAGGDAIFVHPELDLIGVNLRVARFHLDGAGKMVVVACRS